MAYQAPAHNLQVNKACLSEPLKPQWWALKALTYSKAYFSEPWSVFAPALCGESGGLETSEMSPSRGVKT